jgi:23S rRNA (adenine2503-C2)-methyltransferase
MKHPIQLGQNESRRGENCQNESGKMPTAGAPLAALPLLSNGPVAQTGAKAALFGRSVAELTAIAESLGEKPYRGRQLADALYRQRQNEWAAMSTLPLSFRERLKQAGWTPGRPEIVESFRSVDGTERYLIQTGEHTVETVWMPDGDGEVDEPEAQSERENTPDQALRQEWKRATICISSQVGCAVNCQFCLTAKLGLQRNLTAGEIAGQVVAVLERHAVEINRNRINLVFMGMGEPFLNYDNFMDAVRVLKDEVGIATQRMTVSTSGIVPAIRRFAGEPERPRLAISLNAPNDAVRESVMPINRKWPIGELMESLRAIPFKPREKLTFEYVLLDGVTNRREDARELAALVRRSGLPAMVNLIAWNPGPGIDYSSPSQDSVLAFQQELLAAGIQTYIRRPRGRDIYAACGQLKRTTETNEVAVAQAQ